MKRVGHNWSQSVTNLKCDWYKPLFLFSVWNPDQTKMKSIKTEQTVTSVSVFCLESGSDRLLLPCSKLLRVGLSRISSRFPSQIWVSDSDKNVTASHFVTLILQLVNFLGRK